MRSSQFLSKRLLKSNFSTILHPQIKSLTDASNILLNPLEDTLVEKALKNNFFKNTQWKYTPEILNEEPATEQEMKEFEKGMEGLGEEEEEIHEKDLIGDVDTDDSVVSVKRQALISTQLEFKNFHQAYSFMSHVAMVAEAINHHPNWYNVYNRVTVKLSTHDVSDVSGRDIALASVVELYANRFIGETSSTHFTFPSEDTLMNDGYEIVKAINKGFGH